MKVNNYGADHPHAIIRGRVAGYAAVGTADLATVSLGIITPTALAADTDNWNPTGLSIASVIRASTTASWNLTGIVAPSDDRLMILDNIGANDLVLKHNVTSTAANRFYCPNDADLTLTTNTNVWLQYDLTSTRWRIIGGTATGSPIGTPGNAYSLGTLGATHTVTFGNGTWQYGTLNQNCTISFAGFTSGKDDGITLELTEDGTGGWTPTLSGVTWIGTAPTWDTTAGTTTLVGILSRDGGTTILAGIIGGSGSTSPLTTKGDLWGYSTVDARVPVGTDGQVLTADSTASLGVAWTTPATSDTSSWQHVHVENVVYSGDGTTTVFTLPVGAVDANSVQVFVTGSRSLDWTLSGTLLDTLTFGSAPASASNNVVVDIVAVLV